MNSLRFDSITYHYWDAPMPGFVSYEIQATPDSVRLKISAFHGKGETGLPFDTARFDRLLAAFQRHGIGNCQRETQDEGCVGGTTDRIDCQLAGETVFSGKVYHCGGADTGDLCGDIDAFVDELKSMVPEIDRELNKYESGS